MDLCWHLCQLRVWYVFHNIGSVCFDGMPELSNWNIFYHSRCNS